MIRHIDEALQLWAEELHTEQGQALGSLARNPLAALIDGVGVVTRSPRGGRVLFDRSAEIDSIVSKHLPVELRQVVIANYCQDETRQQHKWTACGCSRSQFYRRLALAHESIQAQLLGRAA